MSRLFLLVRKSGFIAAFFLLVFCINTRAASSQDLVERWMRLADERLISQSSVWLSLLHSDGKKSAISDPGFLLSGRDFSPTHELRETLRFLYSGDLDRVCRFPARYVWLKAQLNLPDLSLSHCGDLQEFVAKAPSQTVSLVYASESLVQPASMMGHAFLKLSGELPDGAEVSHAITFFTEAEGYNLPKLFFESTAVGKQGFFALSPFEEELNRYLMKEQRKVWFYELRLDEATRQLIQYHLQELKQTELTYFFQSYNCATLLRYVLGLSDQLPKSKDLWVSPKDVVQDVSQAGLVQAVSVQSPTGWLLRVISEQLTSKETDEIELRIKTNQVEELHFDPDSDRDYLRFSLAKAYADYLQSEKSYGAAGGEAARWLSNLNLYQGKTLSTSEELNPANSPPDSQFSFSSFSNGSQHRYRVSFLPASHMLGDKSSAYTQETELQLMGVVASIDHDQRIRLDSLTLYKMQSYTPYHNMVGGLSSKFLVQWGATPYQAQATSTGWVMSSAVGRTYQVVRDVDLFGFVGLGYGSSKVVDNLPVTAEVGAIVREIGDMKTTISYERRHDLWNQKLVKNQIQIDQSKYVNRNATIFLRIRHSWDAPAQFTEFEFGLKRLF